MVRCPSIGLLLSLLLVVAFGHAQAPDLASMDIVLKSVPDGPVAKVGGVNIGRQDFINLYRADLQRFLAQSGDGAVQDSDRIQIAFQSMHSLMRDETLHQQALGLSISISTEQVEAEWGAELVRLQQSLLGRDGDRLSEDDVLARIGMKNREEAIVRIERMMLIEAMSARIILEASDEMTVTDAEVLAIFEKQRSRFNRPAVYKVRQILIRAKKGDSAERSQARARIEQALGRLQSGESFAGLARELSEAPDSKSGGEMVGTKIQFPAFLIEAISTLEPGEISEVVESEEFGFHLFQFLESKEGTEGSLAEVAHGIRKRLTAARGEQVVRNYCTRLWGSGMPWESYLEIEKNISTNPDYRVESL